jgi:hypothetical protein
MSAAKRQVDHWKVLEQEVPEDLVGKKVLDLRRDGGDAASTEIGSRGAASLRSWDGAQALGDAEGTFDLVVCREALNGTAHPANLLSDIWHATAEGGALLLECRVMTAVELSMYARFVEAASGIGDTEWLPGRLALRWSVETSGFGFVRWLDPEALEPVLGEAHAYLLATRVARPPALDISIPEPAGE